MPVNYLGRVILSQEEFIVDRDSGGFNPHSAYADYLAMIDEQMQMAAQASAEAAALGFELRSPEPPEMRPEDEATLRQIWADIGAQTRRAAEAETLVVAQAA